MHSIHRQALIVKKTEQDLNKYGGSYNGLKIPLEDGDENPYVVGFRLYSELPPACRNAVEHKILSERARHYELLDHPMNKPTKVTQQASKKKSLLKHEAGNTIPSAPRGSSAHKKREKKSSSAIKKSNASVYSSIPLHPKMKNDAVHFVQKEDEPLYYERRMHTSDHFGHSAGYVPSASVHPPVTHNKVTVNGNVMNGLELPTSPSNVTVTPNAGASIPHVTLTNGNNYHRGQTAVLASAGGGPHVATVHLE